MESLTRLSSVFTNLDLSPRWAEAKLRWPEVPEGPPVMSGHVSIYAYKYMTINS